MANRKTRKIAAIAAGTLVVGLGATYTLATWNDSEWVWGGASGDNSPNVGTSTFEVQQNTSAPFANIGWTDEEDNPGGALIFTPGSLSLTPGDTIYAPVALRTTAASVAADTVTLQKAVAANVPGTSTPVAVPDPNGDLRKSIQVKVYTESVADPITSPTRACDAANIAAWGAPVAGVSTLDTAATATQTLAAKAKSTQHYCFALHLPTSLQPGVTATSVDHLQGRIIAPAWEFKSVAN